MRSRRTDANHRSVTNAIRMLGMPVKSLHTQGGGVEDLLVGVTTSALGTEVKSWVLVEVKRSRNKAGTIKKSQFTPAQLEWYELTQGFPRLVVTSADDAIQKLRALCQ